MMFGQYVDSATDEKIAEYIAWKLSPSPLDSKVRGSQAAGSPGLPAKTWRIAVPGGATPFPIFEELAKLGLDFDNVEIWPTDDRIVPEDHPASNTGKIRAIFEPLGAKVVALREDLGPPSFDLVWLGMGADGHIASLFPNTDPDPRDRLRVRRITPDPLPPEAPFDRITLTMPALLASETIMFVIRGDEKRAVFEAADRGEGDLPIARLLKEANAVAVTEITCFT